jgi:hypothetical protein
VVLVGDELGDSAGKFVETGEVSQPITYSANSLPAHAFTASTFLRLAKLQLCLQHQLRHLREL